MRYQNIAMQPYKSLDTISPKTTIRTLAIIHLALVAGQVLFMALSFFTNANPIRLDFANDKHDPLFYVVIILAVLCLNASTIIFKQQITRFNKEAKEKNATLSEKLKAYQTALIVRFALLEGPSLFGIAVFLISGNLYYIIISGLLIVFMLMLRPTAQSAERNLQLTYEETLELQ